MFVLPWGCQWTGHSAIHYKLCEHCTCTLHRTAMYGLQCSWLVTKCIAQGHCMACTALFVTALALITQNTGLAVHSVQSPGFICRLATAIKAPVAFLAFQCTVKKATMNHFQMYPQIRLCQICLYEYIWAFVCECTVRESPVYIAHVYSTSYPSYPLLCMTRVSALPCGINQYHDETNKQ